MTKVDRRFSQIVRTIWSHPKFRKLSKPKPNAQTLVLRLLIAPEMTGVPGLFKAWDVALAADLEWSLSAFRKCLGEVIEAGWASYDEGSGVFWIPGAIDQEANQPANPNVVRSWRTHLAELPDSPLKASAIERLCEWSRGKGPSWAAALDEALGKRKPMPSPNPSGKTQPKTEPKPLVDPLVKAPPNPSPIHEHEHEHEHDDGRASAPRPSVDPPQENPYAVVPCPMTSPIAEDAIPVIAARLEVPESAVRAGIKEFISYWTIGGGEGRTKPRIQWTKDCREHLRRNAERGLLKAPPSDSQGGQATTPAEDAKFAARRRAIAEAHAEALAARRAKLAADYPDAPLTLTPERGIS